MDKENEKPEIEISETKIEAPVADQTPPLKGRAAMMARFKEANKYYEGDPDDDSMFDYAISGMDDMNNKYNSLAGANTRLAEMAASDPKMAALLSMMSGEDKKSMPYAIARIYGKDLMSLEGDDLEEFEKGYQENLAELAASKSAIEQSNKNIEEYKKNLETFAKEEGLTEDQIEKLDEAIYDDAINILHGIIPVEFIKHKWQGMNYEQDVKDAAEIGAIEERGKRFEVKAKELNTAPVGGAAAPKIGAPKKSGKKSFWD